MTSANRIEKISCQLSPIGSQWIMLENFYDIETEEEEQQRLILKAQSVASGARETLAEAERQLVALRPMLLEMEQRVRQWSQWLEEAKAEGNAGDEAACSRSLQSCNQHTEALRGRIQTLENVRAKLTQRLTWIKQRGTHA